MSDGLEPLPDDLRAALDGLVPPAEAPEVREALLSKVHALGAAGALGATTVGASAAGAGLTVPWWVAGVTLLLGLGGGVALDRLIRPAVVEAPRVAMPVEASPPRVAEPVADAPKEVVKEEPPAPAAVRPKPVKVAVEVRDGRAKDPAVMDAGVPEEPPGSPDESLRSERLLIDAARAALARDPRAARAPLDEHAARFPKGQLSEEREALLIQALVLTNDAPGARHRLEAFRRAFPASPLAKVLESAVDSLDDGPAR